MDSRFSCEMFSLTLSSSSFACLCSKVLDELVVFINFYCSFKSNYDIVSITIIFDWGTLALSRLFWDPWIIVGFDFNKITVKWISVDHESLILLWTDFENIIWVILRAACFVKKGNLWTLRGTLGGNVENIQFWQLTWGFLSFCCFNNALICLSFSL